MNKSKLKFVQLTIKGRNVKNTQFHVYHNRANIMTIEIRYLFPVSIIPFFAFVVNPSTCFLIFSQEKR